MSAKKSAILISVVLLACSSTTFADPPWKRNDHHGRDKDHKEAAHHGGGPPPWAPAHGYRARHEGGGYYEEPEIYERRTRQFGILAGTCDRETLGAVLGGVVGGVVGSHAGSDGQRTVATVAGVVVGAVIGREIGKRMDRADQACTGQVLERAADHETIRWRNPQTGVEFLVTPERTFEQGERFCRTFSTVALVQGERRTTRDGACRNRDGSWTRE